MKSYESLIKDHQNWPKEGVIFKDLMPAIANKAAFAEITKDLQSLIKHKKFERTAAIEARGFVFGTALARELDNSLLLVRKAGKLPGSTLKISTTTEYSEDELEIQANAAFITENVLICDDVLATGGTVEAATRLIRSTHAKVGHAVFVIEIEGLSGRERLRQLGVETHSLIKV